MGHKVRMILALAFLLGDLTNGTVKDPDEDRAYEFGFTIEGMQHRHEKKDINGIIQGEFGFITADGVYHVTVYATDENGNFRIISMKNIKVSPPLDGSPDFGSKQYSPIPKGPGSKLTQPKISVPSVQPLEQAKSSSTRRPNRAFTTQPTQKPSCAGCGYITTSKKPPVNSLPTYNKPSVGNLGTTSDGGGLFSGKQALKGIPNGSFTPLTGLKGPKYPGAEDLKQTNLGVHQSVFKPQGLPSNEPSQSRFSGNIPPSTKLSPNIAPLSFSQNTGVPKSNGEKQQIIQTLENRFNDFTGKTVDGGYSGPPASLPGFPAPNQPSKYSTPVDNASKSLRNPSPVEVSNGLIHIPGNPDIPIKDKYPGMVDGLPPGINEKDITNILYKFNWTVGFQGHYETGYKNGAKVGGYFVNGSDGISRVVTYVADEFGYRPKVRIINIGLDSPDTPKDDKTFELKSFEFVWYPVQ
ncbi:hypothetical protein WA026_003516 [Henosepilachna vigintioctopunctata]|uniref:Protein lethal(3)malignant blood neoplasm 1 n=1 Tax=Henosepilachna vigintioctopunctata TaxID=420089 RepID=A0AAW1TNB2_9CUCU